VDEDDLWRDVGKRFETMPYRILPGFAAIGMGHETHPQISGKSLDTDSVKLLVVGVYHDQRAVDPGMLEKKLERPSDDGLATQKTELLRDPSTGSGTTSCCNDKGGN
jgi:hypothetical protein